MVIAEEKVELRKYFKRLRSQLTAEQAAAGSLLTARQILACDAYRKANCIMGYLAFGNELSVDLVLQQALADGKTVAVPLVQSATEMAPVQLENMQNFELDRYGIRSVRQPAKLLQPQQLPRRQQTGDGRGLLRPFSAAGGKRIAHGHRLRCFYSAESAAG